MPTLSAFFRQVESEAFWHALAPWLHVASSTATATPTSTPMRNKTSASLPPDGYLRLNAVLAPERASALARAIATLAAQRIHPTFLYVYDEAWHVLDSLRPTLSPLLGEDFEVLADVWAWHIDPRTDRGGWPIHRGWYEEVRDAAGAPGLLNVWVALTDAGERNACMHVVPLSRDPHYPRDLRNLSALEPLAVPLPAPAGSALVWNANVAHWGGTCDPSFDLPRISMSFTVQRRAGPVRNVATLRPPLPLRKRLDVIAQQFETYGDAELSPESHEMRWAEMLRGMRAAARTRH